MNLFLFLALAMAFNPRVTVASEKPFTETGRANSDIVGRDLEKIEEALVLFHSTDLKTSLSAIHTISDIPYFDIVDLLADMAIYEFKNRKNRSIIEELLNELSKKADRKQLFDENGVAKSDSKLLELKLVLESAVYKETRYEKVRKTYLNLIREIIDNAKIQNFSLPRLSDSILSISTIQENQKKRKSNDGEFSEFSERSVKPEYKNFKEELLRLNTKNRWSLRKEVKAGDSGPIDILLSGTVRFITDEIASDIENNKLFNIVGRNDVLENVLLILSRYRQQNVVLLGSKGSGKTEIVNLLAEHIVTGHVERNEITQFLQNASIIQTSSARISRLAKSDKPAGQADAMEAFFQALSEVQILTKRRIIVFIDELHTLTKEQVESIKPFIESSNSNIMLMGASTAPEFRSAFKHNEAFLSRLQELPVRELSESEILYIFKESWMKTLVKRHRQLQIDEDIMKLIIRKSQIVYPDKGVLRATFQFADDLVTYLRYKNPGNQKIQLSSQNVYNFIQRQIGLPVDPTNFVGMQKYREDLHKLISENVFGQDRLISDVVDLWMGVLRNESPRGVKVGMLMGRSGTGKTETSTQLAVRALGSKERVLVIKASDYADADDIKMSVLFGVPGGVRFGEHSGGILMDWLDDPTKGKYSGIIVIDEAEKASALFWVRFMELLDTGTVVGGDNKTRFLNRHLILLTTNRGDKEIFPAESSTWSEKMLEDRVNSYSEEDLKSLFERELHENDKGQLPDTILNRIDMYSLSKMITSHVAKIISRNMVNKMIEEYFDKSGIVVEVKDATLEQFIKTYDPLKRGARPLVRALDHYIRNAIELALGSVEYNMGDSMDISVGKNERGEPSLRSTMNGKNVHTHLPRYSEQTAESLKCVKLF